MFKRLHFLEILKLKYFQNQNFLTKFFCQLFYMTDTILNANDPLRFSFFLKTSIKLSISKDLQVTITIKFLFGNFKRLLHSILFLSPLELS